MKKLGSILPNIDMGPALFRVKPALKDKVEQVAFRWDDCFCGRVKVIATWTYIEDGETKTFQPDSICSTCRNREIAFDIHEFNQEALMKRWYRIPPDDVSGFKTYEPHNKATERALKETKKYVLDLINGNLKVNLLFMGSTGTGKTHLSKTVAKTAKDKGLKVAFIHAADLFELIKKTFGHERHNQKLFEEYKYFDLVVVDDVGLETKKIGEVNWTVTEWTKLIDAREGKATVFTTNFDDVALGEVVGPRAFSRMYTDTRFIDLFTEDYRKRLKA